MYNGPNIMYIKAPNIMQKAVNIMYKAPYIIEIQHV
jgi:hypothetical protein